MSCHLYLGIAQIAITPPPPHSNGHSGALFFRRDFTIFYHFLPFLPFFTIFSLNKCPKPSGQGFRPPQNQANAPLNLENSSLKKCPKPSGQGFRPLPPNGQCPHGGGDKLKGASLTPLWHLWWLQCHRWSDNVSTFNIYLESCPIRNAAFTCEILKEADHL